MIGQRIRAYRVAHHLSLRQLALLAGLPHHTIWRLETGRSVNPTYHTLERIAHALDIPLTSLLVDTVSPVVCEVSHG